MSATLIAAIFGYLLGAVPFGVLITRALGLGDLRKVGSGNIGATNVLRTGHKGAALATLLLDGGKGAAAVLIARAVAGDGAAAMAGLGAFVGHLYPVWLRFRGGKGVATALGLLLALSFPAGLAACAVWLGAAFVARLSSLAALVAASSGPLWLWLFGGPVWLGVVVAALIFWRHRGNIARIAAGEEPRIGQTQ